MKKVCLFVTMLFLCGCSIDKNLEFSELIIGKWVGYNRVVHFKDGTSLDNLSTGYCDKKTELVFSSDGNLNFIDFNEEEIDNGDTDFCESNNLTSEEGTWELISSERLKLRLTNTIDGTEILIEPYEVRIPDKDSLEIRYREFEDSGSFEGKEISYYIYQYFRVFIN